MRIVSWNVNGLYNTLKDASVRYSSPSCYFSEVLNADIICFQEAKIQEEKLEKWMACVPGYESFWAFSVGKKGYSGVVTYIKEEISPLDARADYLGDMSEDSMKELCREGRLMETDHGSFILINVYVPNAGDRSEGRPRLGFKIKFLKALKQRCDELICAGKHVLILGDFNIARQDIDVYKKWNILDIYSPEEIAWMDAFFAQYVDLFRHFHPDARDVFSVWDQKSEARIHNEGLRIDYAVCDKRFLPQAVDVEIVKMSPKKWSDHAAVVLTLKDQPVLPVHTLPTISSRNMKRFQEDYRQKKLTSLFLGTSLKVSSPRNTNTQWNNRESQAELKKSSEGDNSPSEVDCKENIVSNSSNVEDRKCTSTLHLEDPTAESSFLSLQSNGFCFQEEKETCVLTTPSLDGNVKNKSLEENKVLEVSPTRMSNELHSSEDHERTVDHVQSLNNTREEIDCSVSDDFTHATGDSEGQNIDHEQSQMTSGSKVAVSAKASVPQIKKLKRLLNRKQSTGGKRKPKVQVEGSGENQQKNEEIRSLETHVSQNKQSSLTSYFHKESV